MGGSQNKTIKKQLKEGMIVAKKETSRIEKLAVGIINCTLSWA